MCVCVYVSVCSYVCYPTLFMSMFCTVLKNPFQKSKGLIQKVAFHPSKPLFFVAVSQRQTKAWRREVVVLQERYACQAVSTTSSLLHPMQTQRYVRVYDLSKLQLLKKLLTGVKWISSIDVHPQGGMSAPCHHAMLTYIAPL